MTEFVFLLTPHDPVLLRDGRPFGGQGQDAVTLPWPLPQTTAGAVRTWIGNQLQWDWQADGPDRALAVSIHGPLLTEGGVPMFPRPADALPGAGTNNTIPVMRLSPEATSEGAGVGTLWPEGASLRLLSLPEGATPEPKASLPRHWPQDAFESWLLCEDVLLPSDKKKQARKPPPGTVLHETRVHVSIDPQTGASLETALFATESITLQPQQAMVGRACLPDADLANVPEAGVVTLGGERRVTFIKRLAPEPSPWPGRPPKRLVQALTGEDRVRLVLITPALFSGGWRPGWLEGQSLRGTIPDCHNLCAELVSAAVPRYLPVSGWSYDRRSRGPKRLRRAAPAGSVYFLQLDRPLTSADVEALWMASISDDPQDQRDGYGLAVPGLWT